MDKKMLKWFMATLIVGLIPLLVRLFFYYFLSDQNTFEYVTISDILAFGLIFNVNIFNERDGIFNSNQKISSFATIASCVLIALFVFMYALQLIKEVIIEAQKYISNEKLLFMSVLLSLVSFGFCIIYMVWCFATTEMIINNTESE